MDAPESREIDYDSVDPGTTKPIKAAIRVNDLLETVTGELRLESSLSLVLIEVTQIATALLLHFRRNFDF